MEQRAIRRPQRPSRRPSARVAAAAPDPGTHDPLRVPATHSHDHLLAVVLV